MLKEKLINKALRMIRTSTTDKHLEATKKWLIRLFSHSNYADLFSWKDIVKIIRVYREHRAILLRHIRGEPKD